MERNSRKPESETPLKGVLDDSKDLAQIHLLSEEELQGVTGAGFIMAE